MKVQKTEFLKALKACQPGVSKGKTRLKGSDEFTFKSGYLYSFNDEIAVSVPISYPELEGSIKADEAIKLFTKIHAPEIDIKIRDGYWRVAAGSTTVKLNLYKEDCMEYIESLGIDDKAMAIIPKNFQEALQICNLPKNRTTLEGVAIYGNTAYGSDFARMCFYDIGIEMPRFWLSSYVCKQLQSLDEITHYCITQKWAHFKLSTGAYFSARLTPCTVYPFEDMQNIRIAFAKLGTSSEYNIFPEDVNGAAERVATLCETYDSSPVIDVTFTQDKLVLRGKSTAGVIEERLPFTKAFRSEVNVTTIMTVDFLKEATSKCSRFFFTDDGKLVVEGDNFLQVINGMSRG